MEWIKTLLPVGLVLCALLSPAAQADDNRVSKLTRVVNLDQAFYQVGRPTIAVTSNGSTKQFLVDMAGVFSSVNDADREGS